jgi:hypothetical protein
VSISVSPFFTLDCATGIEITSAPSRRAAISKLDSVRVEFVPNSGQVVRFEIKDGAAAALVFEGMRFERVAVRR